MTWWFHAELKDLFCLAVFQKSVFKQQPNCTLQHCGQFIQFPKGSFCFRDFLPSFHFVGSCAQGRGGSRGVGLKSNEKAALSSQKTVNKQDEVIGTTGCAPLVRMAPLIGLQTTQPRAAPLNFHCSHFPSLCHMHSHCFCIHSPHMFWCEAFALV